MNRLDTAAGWLTPARRKAIYAALAALGAVLVVVGLATDSVVTGWVGIVDAVLGVAALLLASWKARRLDWTALYAAAAAVVTALKTAGVVLDGAAAHWLAVLAALTAAAPLIAATLRTDPSTPTGEPLREYVGRHASPTEA